MAARAALLLGCALGAAGFALCFKTRPELERQYRRAESVELGASDRLLGRAMDYIYSDRTVMSLIARELWDVGARAVDRIVELKGNLPADKRRQAKK